MKVSTVNKHKMDVWAGGSFMLMNENGGSWLLAPD